VAIRFRFSFYDHLVLIECKDKNRKVEVEEVEAFVTKRKDARADKAIMVSAKGFQRQAIKVAKQHGIELYTLTYLRGMPDDLLTEELISVLMIYPIGFRKPPSDNLVILVPPDPSGDLILLSHDPDTLARQMNESVLNNFGGRGIGQLVKIFLSSLRLAQFRECLRHNFQERPPGRTFNNCSYRLTPRSLCPGKRRQSRSRTSCFSLGWTRRR
jgi:hypothetical protein